MTIKSNISQPSPMLPWLAALSVFMLSLDSTILNTALPTIAKALNHPALEMQTVVVAYALILAVFIPMSGWLADRYGTRKVFGIAIFIFSLGSLLCAMSTTFTHLVFSRVIQAIGGSMMMPISRLVLLYSYPKEQLLKVMNYVLIPGLLGPILGPLLGGWLVEAASWHWIFLINVPVGIVGLFLTYRIMPDFTRIGKKFDLIGFVLFGSALILLSLSFELNQISAFTFTHFILILSASIILGVVYIVYSKRISNPIIDIKLLNIRTLRIGLLGNLFTQLGIGCIPYLFPQLLQIVFLHTPTQSGMILMVSGISTIAAKPLVVPLVRKFGYKNILITNTLMLAVVIAMFALPDKTTPLYMLIPILVLYGAINSIGTSAINTISLSNLTPEVTSNGNSLLSITQLLSMSFGVSVGTSILRVVRSSPKLSNGDIGTSFDITFIALGIITSFAALIFLCLHKEDGDNMSGHKEVI